MSMMSDCDLGAPAGQPAAAVDDPNAVYALGRSSGESARLQRQAEELASDSAVLLDRAGVYPAGHSRRTIRADLVRSMHAQIIGMGLADQQELEELDTAVRKHFENPDVLVMPGLYFLTRGRKPASV